MPERSEVYDIPGNTGLSAAARQARIDRFYRPFCAALAECIDSRTAARPARPPAIVTVHSFTPVYMGVRRGPDIGVLHDADARLADALLRITGADTGFVIRRNAPYGPQDGVTHTLVEHAMSRGLLNVMLEIRNDLVADAAGQRAMAGFLSRAVAEALAGLSGAAEAPGRARAAEGVGLVATT